MNRRTFVAVTGAVLAARPSLGASVELTYLADHEGKWEDNEDDLAYAKSYAPDLKERAAFLENLTKFEPLIRKSKGYDSLNGFVVRAHRSIRGAYPEELPPHPIPGGFFIQHFFWYSRPGGKPELDEESPFHMYFLFNSIDTVVDGGVLVAKDAEAKMILEPPRGESKHGFPTYPEGTFVTKREGDLFKPVTKERVLKAWIADAAADAKKAPKSAPLAARVDALRNTLEKLSAEEKAAPAVAQPSSQYSHAFATEKEKLAARVVTMATDFFDAKQPRSALQSFIIKKPNPHHGESYRPPHVNDPVDALWAALKFDLSAMRDALS